MITVELVVSLKIPDVTALTAANAIRRRLGYADRLLELHRADYYRLELDVPDRAAAEALARELAEDTNLFVNPNKHVFAVRFPEDRDGGPAAPGEQIVNVLVTSPDDTSGAGLAATLRGHLGYDAVGSIATGVLWTMRLAADSPEAARAMAEEIAITRSQSQGLLMNPHFQEIEVWMGA